MMMKAQKPTMANVEKAKCEDSTKIFIAHDPPTPPPRKKKGRQKVLLEK